MEIATIGKTSVYTKLSYNLFSHHNFYLCIYGHLSPLLIYFKSEMNPAEASLSFTRISWFCHSWVFDLDNDSVRKVADISSSKRQCHYFQSYVGLRGLILIWSLQMIHSGRKRSLLFVQLVFLIVIVIIIVHVWVHIHRLKVHTIPQNTWKR